MALNVAGNNTKSRSSQETNANPESTGQQTHSGKLSCWDTPGKFLSRGGLTRPLNSRTKKENVRCQTFGSAGSRGRPSRPPSLPDSASKWRQLTKGKLVKMQSKWDLVPRAWSYRTQDGSLPLVSVKMSTLFFLLEIAEARKFAAEIITAADAAEAGER